MTDRKSYGSWSMKFVSFAILVLVFLLVIYPLFWTFMSSLKLNWAIFRDPTGLPRNPTFDNYVEMWTKASFGTFFFNSVLVTGLGLVGRLTFSALTAYAFARFRFKWSDSLFLLFVMSLAIPGPSLMVAEYVLLASLNLIGTHLGLVLFYMSWSAFAIVMFRNAFKAIPQEIVDAAVIDGCGELRLFARIMLPLIKPTMSVLVIFTFVWLWNDFLWPNLFLQRAGQETIMVGLFNRFRGEYDIGYGLMTAGLSIALIPVLIVYLIFQRYFIRGLTLGGVKE